MCFSPDNLYALFGDLYGLLIDICHFFVCIFQHLIELLSALVDCFVAWCRVHWPWAIQPSHSDSSIWAIGFTMNTWTVSLDRARFQLHGLIRTAIDDSRATAQQAHFLERLVEWKNQDHRQVKIFLNKYQDALDEIDRIIAKHPSLRESEIRSEPISWFPRFVLLSFAVFSVCCLVFGWYYNITLIVLFPYPVICLYYQWERLWLPSRIRRRFKKLMDMIPEMERNINEEKQEIDNALNELLKRFNPPENT